jgi:hypothetical protein
MPVKCFNDKSMPLPLLLIWLHWKMANISLFKYQRWLDHVESDRCLMMSCRIRSMTKTNRTVRSYLDTGIVARTNCPELAGLVVRFREPLEARSARTNSKENCDKEPDWLEAECVSSKASQLHLPALETLASGMCCKFAIHEQRTQSCAHTWRLLSQHLWLSLEQRTDDEKTLFPCYLQYIPNHFLLHATTQFITDRGVSMFVVS